MAEQDDGSGADSDRRPKYVTRERWNKPAWCKALGLHWEGSSINGEEVMDGVLRPQADLRPLTDWMSWSLSGFGSRCRSLLKQTGALSYRYRGKGTRTVFVRSIPGWTGLMLKDARAIRHRLAERGADVPSRSLPALWVECESYAFWSVPGRSIPTGKQKSTNLVILAEERQVFVPARPTPLGEGTKSKWRESLDLLAALDREQLRAGLRRDEKGFLANVLVLVHRERSEGPLAPLERCYERHHALVSELRAATAEPTLPIAWNGLLRLPLALTAKGRFPAISFVVAMRAIRTRAVTPAGEVPRADGTHLH